MVSHLIQHTSRLRGHKVPPEFRNWMTPEGPMWFVFQLQVRLHDFISTSGRRLNLNHLNSILVISSTLFFPKKFGENAK